MRQLSFKRKLAFIDYAIRELQKGDDAEDSGICLIFQSSQFAFKHDDWSDLDKRFPELQAEINKVIKRQGADCVLDYSAKMKYISRIKLLNRVKDRLV